VHSPRPDRGFASSGGSPRAGARASSTPHPVCLFLNRRRGTYFTIGVSGTDEPSSSVRAPGRCWSSPPKVSRTRDLDEFTGGRGSGSETVCRVAALTFCKSEGSRLPLLMTVESRSSGEDPFDSAVADEPATPPVVQGRPEERIISIGVDRIAAIPENVERPASGADPAASPRPAPRASVGVRDAGWFFRRPASPQHRRAPTCSTSSGAAAPHREEIDEIEETWHVRSPRAGAHV